MNFSFPGQRPDEQVILVNHRHWIAYLPDVLFGIVGAVAPFIILAVLPMADVDVASSPTRNILIVTYSLWFLALTTWLFVRWLDYYLDLCVITDSRVVDIDQFGLFRRNVAELEFEEVQDVTVTKSGILAAIFNFGHIEIQTAGEKRNFYYNTVPNPEYIVSVLSQSRDTFTSGKKQNTDESVTAQVTSAAATNETVVDTTESPSAPASGLDSSAENTTTDPVTPANLDSTAPSQDEPSRTNTPEEIPGTDQSSSDTYQSIPREPE